MRRGASNEHVAPVPGARGHSRVPSGVYATARRLAAASRVRVSRPVAGQRTEAPGGHRGWTVASSFPSRRRSGRPRWMSPVATSIGFRGLRSSIGGPSAALSAAERGPSGPGQHQNTGDRPKEGTRAHGDAPPTPSSIQSHSSDGGRTPGSPARVAQTLPLIIPVAMLRSPGTALLPRDAARTVATACRAVPKHERPGQDGRGVRLGSSPRSAVSFFGGPPGGPEKPPGPPGPPGPRPGPRSRISSSCFFCSAVSILASFASTSFCMLLQLPSAAPPSSAACSRANGGRTGPGCGGPPNPPGPATAEPRPPGPPGPRRARPRAAARPPPCITSPPAPPAPPCVTTPSLLRVRPVEQPQQPLVGDLVLRQLAVLVLVERHQLSIDELVVLAASWRRPSGPCLYPALAAGGWTQHQRPAAETRPPSK